MEVGLLGVVALTAFFLLIAVFAWTLATVAGRADAHSELEVGRGWAPEGARLRASGLGPARVSGARGARARPRRRTAV
jgi:hypothetical protein